MSSSPEIGAPVPDFTLSGGRWNGESFERADYTLSAQRGRSLVLAFYPGDHTSVCTRQLCAYSSGWERFAELDAEVWGISPQDVDSHEGFARSQDLRLPLLADTGRTVTRKFGVALPGLGLRRSVFLVAPDGTLAWRHIALLGMTYQPLDTLIARLAEVNRA
ncbi:peroxiredoxin [Streptomyces sp. NPDC005438]|uniref:peroxiredoxin n=1 Tax=Streptomyces sp. NPDC005438 TaxID=3156880 RepID=UPI0033B8FF62